MRQPASIGRRAAYRSEERIHRPVKRLLSGVENPALDLVLFNGFEKRLEIALAETFISLALDQFEENRAAFRPAFHNMCRAEEP